MNRSFALLVLVGALVFALGAQAQVPSAGVAGKMAPEVSAPTPQAGCFVYPASHSAGPNHTNYVLFSQDCRKPLVVSAPTAIDIPGPTVAMNTGTGPAVTVTTYQSPENPASLGCLYVKNPSRAGCPPRDVNGYYYTGGPSYLGYGAIAIVDAFDNPNAASDLAYFDSFWGLSPPPSFTKIYANGNGACVTPPADHGWSVESSMDIEYAHVFAPKAAIVLVEACSNYDSDLYYAEQVAFNYLVNGPFKGSGGQVTNSWGHGEWSGQLAWDAYYKDSWPYGGYFVNTHVQAFASAGDSGLGAGFPSSSPWIISAGGTSILRYTTPGGIPYYFYKETCWGGSGGGASTYETYQDTWVNNGSNAGPWANYQAMLFGYTLNGSPRATPDMSFNADPASGAWVYSAYGLGGWSPVGGTSLSSPALAGIVNRAGNKVSTWGPGAGWYTAREHELLYSQLGTATLYKANFYDVTTGSNGASAKVGWDYCTGVGSPRGISGK